MDRLAVARTWKDTHFRDQAILVAANQDIDWEDVIAAGSKAEGETDEELWHIRVAVRARKNKQAGAWSVAFPCDS